MEVNHVNHTKGIPFDSDQTQTALIGPALRPMPNAQDGNGVMIVDTIHDDVRLDDDQLPRVWDAAPASSTRKNRQTRGGDEKLSGEGLRSYGVFLGNVGNDARNIGTSRRTPNDRHNKRGSGGGASNSPEASRNSQACISS